MAKAELAETAGEVPASVRDPGTEPPLADLRKITKRFPGVLAIDQVDFDVRRGEVHVLFGENGAGKSTLTNIVAGTYPADAGEFYFQGQRITHLTPYQARSAGISPVFQETAYAHGSGWESLPPDVEVEVRAGERVECSLYVPADGATT